jgi:hypothetical protein
MIVQPREPNPGSMLEHVADADARRYEPWVTDCALMLDEHGRVRVNYAVADRLRVERRVAL